MSKEYYNQDLCDSGGRCKLYNPLQTNGQCVYYNEWCELKDKISDLEAKLAKSKESCILLEGLRKSEAEKKDIAMKRVSELKQQLAEKEKENELMAKTLKMTKFVEKEINQDKISFALEQLEKVKETLLYDKNFYFSNWQQEISEVFDNQIRQLKEGK